MMQAIASGCMTVKETFEDSLLYARDLGFREMDLLFVSGWAHIGTDELAMDFAGVCRRAERALSASGIAPAAVNAKFSIALEATGEAAAQREKEANAVMAFMQAFGVRRISIQPTLSAEAKVLQDGAPPAIRETLRLRNAFAERGLRLSLEPHILSWFCTNHALRTVRRDAADFPVTFDPSHLLHEGEPMESVLWLCEGTTMVHLRDAAPGRLFVPFGQGALDVKGCIRSLAQAGYDGPIALEYIADHPGSPQETEDLLAFRRAVDDAAAQTGGMKVSR